MRTQWKALLLAGALCAGLTGCGTADKTADSQPTADYQIDVILKTTASEYWQYVQAGAQAYGAEHEDITVNVTGAANETAYDEQEQLLRDGLAGTCDALVIAPLQADTVAGLIAGENRPIIACDTAIDAPEVVSFVGTGNEQAAALGGKLAAEAAAEAGWPLAEAVMISGVQGDSTAQARLNGFRQGVEDAGGVFLADETQYADADPDKAAAIMQEIMTRHPDGVAIIVCNNDDMAMAAAQAAADNSAYANTVFVGFDGTVSACQAILDGRLTMSVAQMAYEMGYLSVDTAVSALNGEAVNAFVDSGAEIIDADNAQGRMDMLQEHLAA